MTRRAWRQHVVAVLRDPDAHRQQVAVVMQRPFEAARRHSLVDLEAQDVRAEVALIAGFKALCGLGIRVSDGQNAANYVVSRVIVEGLARGFSSADLGRALRRLVERGTLVRDVVGVHRNGSAKSVLQLACAEQQANGGPARDASQVAIADALEPRRRADRA